MGAPLTTTLADLPQLSALDLGSTAAWIIPQADVDRFAELTGDRQWIHVDVERSAAAGGTIVHGLLLLGLIGGAWSDWLHVSDATAALNYGLDRVRFLAPVPVGSSVRLTAALAEVLVRADGVRVSVNVSLFAGAEVRAAVVARSIVLFRA